MTLINNIRKAIQSKSHLYSRNKSHLTGGYIWAINWSCARR